LPTARATVPPSLSSKPCFQFARLPLGQGACQAPLPHVNRPRSVRICCPVGFPPGLSSSTHSVKSGSTHGDGSGNFIRRSRARKSAPLCLVERLRAHALGEIGLSPTQIRVAEILLRKVIPGFRAGWVLNCGRHRGERFGTDAQKQYDLLDV
jgi:hypothetical protein